MLCKSENDILLFSLGYDELQVFCWTGIIFDMQIHQKDLVFSSKQSVCSNFIRKVILRLMSFFPSNACSILNPRRVPRLKSGIIFILS